VCLKRAIFGFFHQTSSPLHSFSRSESLCDMYSTSFLKSISPWFLGSSRDKGLCFCPNQRGAKISMGITGSGSKMGTQILCTFCTNVKMPKIFCAWDFRFIRIRNGTQLHCKETCFTTPWPGSPISSVDLVFDSTVSSKVLIFHFTPNQAGSYSGTIFWSFLLIFSAS
jgi:hypothetical protein